MSYLARAVFIFIQVQIFHQQKYYNSLKAQMIALPFFNKKAYFNEGIYITFKT